MAPEARGEVEAAGIGTVLTEGAALTEEDMMEVAGIRVNEAPSEASQEPPQPVWTGELKITTPDCASAREAAQEVTEIIEGLRADTVVVEFHTRQRTRLPSLYGTPVYEETYDPDDEF